MRKTISTGLVAALIVGAGCSSGTNPESTSTIPGAGVLTVSPAHALAASGPAGGAFSPPKHQYTVRNDGEQAIDVTIESDVEWIELSTTSQRLEPDAELVVEARLRPDRTSGMAPGRQSGRVTFEEVQSGSELTSQVDLTIQEPTVTFDHYVDAQNGDDANDGSSGSPWRSLGKAMSSAGPGAIVAVMNGNYGALAESSASGRTQFLTLRAAPGASPVIAGISLNYGALTDSYLRIDGFEVFSDSRRNLVDLDYARHVHVRNCTVHAEKWATNGLGVDGFEIVDCANILIEGTYVHEVNRGATISRTTGLTVRRNYIRPKAGSAIQYAGGNEDGLIEFNHIHGEPYVGYPADPDAVQNPHASIISVRSSDLVIRGNHMHGMGNSSGIMFYRQDAAGGEDAYSNITLENNALYDVTNTYALRINNLGSNVVIRNNLIYSNLRSGDCNGVTPDARYRYSNALIVHNVASGHDGSGLELYNNILIGIVSVPSSARERNNIAWSWYSSSTWHSTSPSGTSMIVTSSHEGCGNHSRFFESGFFADTPDFRFRDPIVADWTLAAQSVGRNFGDASVQPAQSLGSIGPDGFLVDDGPARSGSVHSVGPYERTPD